MLYNSAVILVFAFSCMAVNAQPPDTLWTRTFGGYFYDVGYSVEQSIDGGYVVAGFTGSYGGYSSDVWLIKTDAAGNQQWEQTYSADEDDVGNSVKQTSDGGYIMTGLTGFDGYYDVWLIKTDAAGNQQWEQTFGGTYYEVGKCVQQTADGGYIIVGNIDSHDSASQDIWLIKTDSTGNQQWEQTFGGSDWDSGSDVKQTTDGGYIITGTMGQSYGTDNGELWLIKTDSAGNQQWEQTYGGSNCLPSKQFALI